MRQIIIGASIMLSLIIVFLVGLAIGVYNQPDPIPCKECPGCECNCPSFQTQKCKECPVVDNNKCVADFLDEVDRINKQKELIKKSVGG